MTNGYQIFLMIQLAIVKGVIEKELEYDLQWEQGQKLLEKFENSIHNNSIEPRYESIEKFLDDELKPTETFHLNVYAVEVNKYSYSVNAKSADDALAKLGKYLEHHCPYPSDVNNELGIVCDDREAGHETIEVKSITLNKPFHVNQISPDDLPF